VNTLSALTAVKSGGLGVLAGRPVLEQMPL